MACALHAPAPEAPPSVVPATSPPTAGVGSPVVGLVGDATVPTSSQTVVLAQEIPDTAPAPAGIACWAQLGVVAVSLLLASTTASSLLSRPPAKQSAGVGHTIESSCSTSFSPLGTPWLLHWVPP